jgi:hypothetical protein
MNEINTYASFRFFWLIEKKNREEFVVRINKKFLTLFVVDGGTVDEGKGFVGFYRELLRKFRKKKIIFYSWISCRRRN